MFVYIRKVKSFKDILQQDAFSKADLVRLLSAEGEDRTNLFGAAEQRKKQFVGNKVYYRGLVEFSNICSKDCLYCGIRKSNEHVVRYKVDNKEVLEACEFAWKNRFGSVVLQSGELSSPDFVNRVDGLLQEIKKMSNGELGITLSCGEQTRETYQRWRKSGAHRYLLRIESSTKELYNKIHPNNSIHLFEKRLEALQILKECDFQVGTGVMIGLPFQTMENLADDILFFQKMDVDMVGMGPFIEHEDTPLYEFRDGLMTKQERFDLALRMVATLRLHIPDINIAAATALQAIDLAGREKALKIGANIIMPNLTPTDYRKEYQLYEDKPCLDEDAELCRNCLEARVELSGNEIAYDEWGDSPHYFKRKQSK